MRFKLKKERALLFIFLFSIVCGVISLRSSYASRLSDLFFAKGLEDLSANKLEEALEKFTRAVKADPKDAEASLYLGITYFRLKKFQEAIDPLDKALKLNPSLTQAYFYLGTSHYNLKGYRKAEEELRKAVEAEPKNASAHYYLGLIFHETEEFTHSPIYFEKARNLNPDLSLTSYYYSGIAYFRRNEFRRAKEEFRQAISLNPESDVAKSSGEFIQTIEEREVVEKKWLINVGLSSQYDDNVVLTPVDPGIVSDIADQSDIRTMMNLQGEYRPILTQKAVLGLRYNLFQSLHDQLDRFDVRSNRGSIYASYQLFPNLRLQMDYSYDLIDLDNDRFLQVHSFNPLLSFSEGDFGLSVIQFEHQIKDFFSDLRVKFPIDLRFTAENIAGGNFFLNRQDRDAFNDSFTITQYLFFSKGKRYISLEYRYEDEDTEGADFKYNGSEMSIGVFSPLFFDINLFLKFGYNKRDYDRKANWGFEEVARGFERAIIGANSRFVTRTVSRDDDRYHYEMSFSKDLGPHLQLNLRYVGTTNDSNVTIFEYDRNIVSLSLSLTF